MDRYSLSQPLKNCILMSLMSNAARRVTIKRTSLVLTKLERTVLENDRASYTTYYPHIEGIQWANYAKQCDLDTVGGEKASTLALQQLLDGRLGGRRSHARGP